MNVLFITVDQWRGDCLSAAGHPVVETPTLDRLAAAGVRFTRHFAQAAPCGPSRASIYTGLYLMNHRSATNGTPLDARFTNVALEARMLGYDPALFGYTDTSVDPRTVTPDDPRLRSYEGVLPGFTPVCHLPEGDPAPWLEWLRAEGYDLGDHWRTLADRPADGAPPNTTKYRAEHSQTKFLTDRVLEHVASCGDAPWFAHASYLRPHPPFLAPDPYNTRYDPADVPVPVRAASRSEEGAQHPLLATMIEHPLLAAPDDERELRQLRATYYGMMREVDDQLARLLDWLDKSGQASRTIVVLTSDHGEMLGDHYLLHKLGWFDAAYHIPLLVRDPRPEFDGARGRVVDAFTENVDITPTILDLLGARVPPQCDGCSLVPWLRGATPDDWRTEVHWEFDFRMPGSDLLEQAFGITMEECSLAVLRDDHGKYVHFGGLPPVFFDLDDDPAQTVNRAPEPACRERVLEYAQRMLSWRMRHQDRTLASMQILPDGLVERYAPRR
jgi:arylsulfatase A-like enzyme